MSAEINASEAGQMIRASSSSTGISPMKVSIITGIICAIVGVVAFQIGQGTRNDESVRENPFSVFQGAVIVTYKGNHYAVGVVDSLGQARISTVDIMSFLLVNADDKGIRSAAEYIGFTGSQVTVRDTADVP
jgi:hypothetical protein